MLLSTSRLAARRYTPFARRTLHNHAVKQHASRQMAPLLALAAVGGFTAACSLTLLDTIPTSGDVLMMQPAKEKSTGILFPKLCNGMTLVGTGVRVKWGLIKVYAVGTYVDPIAMSAVKKAGDDAVSKAMLNTMYPKTIRIVMARSLSIKKYTDAIVEAIEPRMNGQDLDK